MTVVTRFAPSPTGFLHIGGARTALFNWLYARGRGGKMLLRIEDTDRERSTQAAIDAILDGLSWLGIDWDGDVVYQFSRAARHREVAEQLLASGHAYRCYASPEELKEMREAARREGRARLYDGRWRDRDPGDAPPDVRPAIRLKAPLTGETVIDDQVQGRVVWQNENLDDLVLLRSDGTPTYMLAVVVDDHDMAVTHIIRGDDHLTNAARQKQIYDALGWAVPVMSHISLIHGPDGSKLSKRHGALGVEAYRAMGYLPAALRNYLVRLGWSHGDQETFSTEEMTAEFDLPQIGRSPARFDLAKLESLNGHYIRATSDEALLDALDELLPHIDKGAAFAAKLTPEARSTLLKAMPFLKQRAKTLLDLISGAEFLFDRPRERAKAFLNPEASSRLYQVAQYLTVSDWKPETTEQVMRAFADLTKIKLGSVAQPLRVVLTGSTTSPGIFDVLELLGKRESIDRIVQQIEPTTVTLSSFSVPPHNELNRIEMFRTGERRVEIGATNSLSTSQGTVANTSVGNLSSNSVTIFQGTAPNSPFVTISQGTSPNAAIFFGTSPSTPSVTITAATITQGTLSNTSVVTSGRILSNALPPSPNTSIASTNSSPSITQQPVSDSSMSSNVSRR
jgi:glutamyl-tRNA synthetase